MGPKFLRGRIAPLAAGAWLVVVAACAGDGPSHPTERTEPDVVSIRLAPQDAPGSPFDGRSDVTRAFDDVDQRPFGSDF